MTHQTLPIPTPSETDPWPSLCRPSEFFGYRLWHVGQAWQRRLEAALSPLDLTRPQFVVLGNAAWLSRDGSPTSQNQIACYAAMDPMNVSKVVRLLECKGYLARSPHPDDSRANRVEVTALGRDVLARAFPICRAEQDAFFGRLPEEGQRSLAEQLDALLRLEGIGGRED